MPDTVRSVSRRGQATAIQPVAATRPRSRLGHRLGHALAVAGLFVCVVPLLLTSALALRLRTGPIDVSSLARRLTAPLAEQAGTLHGLTLGRVRLAWRDYEVGVLLDDVRLDDGHADHVALAIRPWPLLRRHVVLLQAEAIGAELRFRRGRDGAVGLQSGPSPGANGASPLDLAAVRSLLVSHSVVLLDDSASGQACRLDIADFALAPLRRPAAVGAAGRLDAGLSCGGALLHLSGDGRELPDGSIAWRIRTDPVVPAGLVPPALARSMPALAGLGDLRLPVAVTLDSVLTGGYGAYMIPRAVQVTAALGPGTVLLPDRMQTDTVPVASGLIALNLALPDDGSVRLRALLAPSRLMLAGPDAPEFLLSGQGWMRGQALHFGVVAEAPRIAFAGLDSYWPSLLARGARQWVAANITDGTAHDFRLDVGMSSSSGPDGLRLDRLQGGVDADGMVLHWLRPIPPIRALDGHLVFDGPNSLHITVRHGIQEVADHAPLAVGTSAIRITGLSVPRQDAHIEASLSGGLADLLALLAHPRLRLLSQHKLPFRDPAGRIQARLQVDLPLIDKLGVDAIGVHAQASLTGVHLGDVAVGRDLDQAALTLEASQDGLSAHGSGLIGGMKSTLSYSTDFRAGPPDQRTESAQVTSHVTDAAVQQEGLDEAHRFTGEALLDVAYEHRRSGAARVALGLDLTQAGLDTPLWRKQPATPATASGVFGLQDQHLVSIDSLHASGDGLAFVGRADVRGGRARTVVIDRFTLGRSQGSGRIDLPSKPGQPVTPLRLSLHGPVLDVLPYLSEAAPARSSQAAGKSAPAKPVPDQPWQADLAFQKVLFSATRSFSGVTLQAQARGSTVSTARLRVAGPTPVAVTLQPERARRRLRLQADDTGALLRALGVVDTIEGGALSLDGTLEPASGSTRLKAVATIGQFTVHDAPLAARMARDLSVYGFLLGAPTKQLVVTRFEVPFVLTGGTLMLTGAHASNAALGATLRGPIHLARETLDLKGTIVPSYLFNALPGKLPGIGAVFSPEKGGRPAGGHADHQGVDRAPATPGQPAGAAGARHPAPAAVRLIPEPRAPAGATAGGHDAGLPSRSESTRRRLRDTPPPGLETDRGPAPSARGHLGRTGGELRPVLGPRHQGRALPVRPVRRNRTRPHRAARIHRRGLARLPAGCPTGHRLRLPGARPVRAGRRPSLQPEQAAARPLRPRACRPGAACARDLQLHDRPSRRRPLVRHPRQRGVHAEMPGDRPRLYLGPRPAPAHPLGPHDLL